MPTTSEKPDYVAMGKNMRYEDKIRTVFKELAEKNDGASPAEVTDEMANRGWLSPLDTVIDIADQMRELRDAGFL